jgi:hypothetical protein
MAYYFRAFCTASVIPTPAKVLEWVRERGVSLTIEGLEPGESERAITWDDGPLSLIAAGNAAPFTVELNKNENVESLAALEINEFLAEVRATKKTRKRDRVIEHLYATQYVVPCEIPVKEFDDAGFHAVDVFLAYFLAHSDGMVQADGQGFYDMGTLIVELE